MQDKLVFDQTFEGLFIRGLQRRLTPSLKSQLRNVGVDLDRKLLPAYPFETWCSCVRIAARELYPNTPTEQAYHSLGELMVSGFRGTMMGRALFGMLQLVGSPHQMLSRMQQSFRSGNNYTQVRLQELASTRFELWVNEPGPTRHLMQGAILAGLSGCGVRHPQVELVRFTSEDATFLVQWRAG